MSAKRTSALKSVSEVIAAADLPDIVETPAASTRALTDLTNLPSVWGLEARLDWCVADMIAQGSVTLICSESGVGKTWLGYYIAGCVAHGWPVASREVRQSKVLYVDGENPLYVVKQRLNDLGIQETSELHIWGGWYANPPEGPDSQLVTDFARKHKPLIIFDSLIEFHPGSEQSSTETRAFMRYFRALANLGATVIVLHHSGKAETAKIYRGSSDIKAAVDTAYQLDSAVKDANRLGQLSLKCFKGRLVPGQNFGLQFREREGFVACEVPAATKTITEVIAEILRTNPNSNQSEIVRQAQARGSRRRDIELCLKDGDWSRRPGPKNSTLFDLPATELDADEAN
jgi:predicted ATP-dependent serine protease